MNSVAVPARHDVSRIDLGDREVWRSGPPHELFDLLRREAPVHWSPMAGWEGEPGFWSITRAQDIRAVSLDWETYSSEAKGIVITNFGLPVEMQNQQMLGLDPPRHDRLKALFQRGFTPKRIAEHEHTIREIAHGVLDGVCDQEVVELVYDVGAPIVGRVIGSFLGTPREDDATWAAIVNQIAAIGDEQAQPDGAESIEAAITDLIGRVMALAADRREHPTDDLTSVLVHAEVDGERLTDLEVAMGFAVLVAAGNDSTRTTYTSGMRALIEHPEQRQRLLDDPSKIPAAVEEFLRMYPAFAHFRRTATRDVELHGKTIHKGDKVILWYPSGNRDESLYDCPHQLELERAPEHQAFGAGGRHFCLGASLARLELKIMFEETLKRYPEMQIVEEPEYVNSPFASQLRALPVRLRPQAHPTETTS